MQKNRTADPAGNLPLTRSLTPALILSAAAIVLTVLVAIVGIIFQAEIYGAGESADSARFVDIVTLVFAVPLILLSIILAYRGKWNGLICWPGMLYYLVYNYIPPVFDLSFGVLLLPYLFIVAIGLSALIMLLTAIDCEQFSRRLTATVPAKTAGGILLGLGIFVILHQAGDIISVLSGISEKPQSTTALYFADFLLAVPALFGSGLLLWKKRSFGYVAGGALYFAYGTLCIGLLLFFILEALFSDAAFDAMGFAIIFVMTALCAVPFIYFIRADRKSTNLKHNET